MSIEQSRIEQLEAELVIARGRLKLAGDADHARLKHLAELERRITQLATELKGQREGNRLLREGIRDVIAQMRRWE